MANAVRYTDARERILLHAHCTLWLLKTKMKMKIEFTGDGEKSRRNEKPTKVMLVVKMMIVKISCNLFWSINNQKNNDRMVSESSVEQRKRADIQTIDWMMWMATAKGLPASAFIFTSPISFFAFHPSPIHSNGPAQNVKSSKHVRHGVHIRYW